MKVQSVYNSRILKKCFEFAANNGALFAASATVGFSMARPLIILATPKTDEQNKRYAGTKSIASTLIGYLLMLAASKPIAKAVKNIDNNPSKYLSSDTIRSLSVNGKNLTSSKKYSFATQLFKLGVGFVLAAPKAALTCALIPPIMLKLFGNSKKFSDNIDLKETNKISFRGLYSNGVKDIPYKISNNFKHVFGDIGLKSTDMLAKGIGNIINTKGMQNFINAFNNTRFEQHIISLTDLFSTAAFIQMTQRSKKIEKDRKDALIYNSAISTIISVAGGYIIDSLTKKPTEKFIENFKKANIHSPKLDKYVEGIRVVKPVLILGTLYYIFIPLISTFMADRLSNKSRC